VKPIACALVASALTLVRVEAQALADAARKAEDQRKSAGAGMTVTKLSVSPFDGDLQEVELTQPLFDQYARTRATVGSAFGRDIPLHERVTEAVRQLKSARGATAVYESEPKLKQAIEFNGFTVAGFMDVVLTIQRASFRAGSQKVAGVLSPIQTANTAFMRENDQQVRALEYKLGVSNSWLLPIPSYFLKY